MNKYDLAKMSVECQGYLRKKFEDMKKDISQKWQECQTSSQREIYHSQIWAINELEKELKIDEGIVMVEAYEVKNERK